MSPRLELHGADACLSVDELFDSDHAHTVLTRFNQKNHSKYTMDEVRADYNLAALVSRYFAEWIISGRVQPVQNSLRLVRKALREIKANDVGRRLPFNEAYSRFNRQVVGFDFQNAVQLIDHFYSGREPENNITQWPNYMPEVSEGQIQRMEEDFRADRVDHLFFDSGMMGGLKSIRDYLGEERADQVGLEKTLRGARSLGSKQLKEIFLENGELLESELRSALEMGSNVNATRPAYIGFVRGGRGYTVETDSPLACFAPMSYGEEPSLLTLGQYLTLTDYLYFLQNEYQDGGVHDDFLSDSSRTLWTPLDNFTRNGEILIVQGDKYSQMGLKMVSATAINQENTLARRNLTVY